MSALAAYVGVPYKECDCWEMCRRFSREQLGIELPEFFYDKAHLAEQAAQHMANETTDALGVRWAAVTEPRVGDIALFRIKGLVSHSGIVVEDNLILHCLEGRDSCIEEFAGTHWETRLYGMFRWIA
jgi:cell wall-associated NlpC family hydrolase